MNRVPHAENHKAMNQNYNLSQEGRYPNDEDDDVGGTPENLIQPNNNENFYVIEYAKVPQGIDEGRPAQNAVPFPGNAGHVLSNTKVLELLDNKAKAQVGSTSCNVLEAKDNQHWHLTN